MPELIGSALDSVRITIENLVRTRWTMPDGQLLTAVKFQDANKLESATGEIDREPEKLPWLKVDILWGDSFRDLTGPASQNLNVGVVQLTLFYPKQFPAAPGAAGITKLADKVRTIFSNQFGDGVNFEASSLPQRPPDENQWKVAIVRTNFEFWECN